MSNTVLYKIEQAIKAYRKFSQKRITDAGLNITVDQALVLMMLDSDEDLSQVDIARLVFKDNASITRILQLMVDKRLIQKSQDPKDKRRSVWTIMADGRLMLERLQPYISSNREQALASLSEKDLAHLARSLDIIVENCSR